MEIGDIIMITGHDRPSFTNPHPYAATRVTSGPFVVCSTGGSRLGLAVKHTSEGGRNPGWNWGSSAEMTETMRDAVVSLNQRASEWRGWWVYPTAATLATPEQQQALTPALLDLANALRNQTGRPLLDVTTEAVRAATPVAAPVAAEITDLAEYKAFVARRVTEEATRRGWCSEVDGWLSTLGLERVSPGKVRYTLTLTAEEDIPPNVTDVAAFISGKQRQARNWADTRTMTLGQFPELSARSRDITIEAITPTVPVPTPAEPF